jgi:hypothetical protein
MSNSQSIDFIFVTYSSSTGIFDVTTVDMTISESKTLRRPHKSLELLKLLLRKVGRNKNKSTLQPK